jgi:glycosidase
MPKLNMSNPEVQDYILEVAKYWIKECDIDGWRLDVGDEVPHEFWKRFRKEVRSVKSDALIVGEVWYYANDFLEGDEWDTVMNYIFYGAIMDLVAHEGITVSQFVDRIGFTKGNLHTKVYPLLFNLIDSHDTPRFLHSAGNSHAKQKLAAAFQLLSPGMPMIYYGDEYAMQGAQDPDNRRGMYWDEEYQNKEMYAWYQSLIRLRKNYSCICTGKAKFYAVNDELRTLELTKANDTEEVTLLFNCSKEERDMSKYHGMKNLITGQIFEGRLQAYEVVVLE